MVIISSEKTYSQRIAETSTKLTLADIDARTVDNAKLFMLDCLGCILSGSQIVNARVIRSAVRDIADGGSCTIFGTGAKTNPMMAALVNGTAGHSQDYDDDHREGTQHASVAVLPAVMALAEKYGKSGADVLLAYMIGSDVTIRSGEAFMGTSYYAGWHLTGTCGVMGAAAGAAKIMDLDVQQTVDALGVAGSAAGGLGAFNSNGSWTKRFHAGQSAMNGVLCAKMGQAGYFAPAAVYEDKDGWLNCFSFKGGSSGYEIALPNGIQDGSKLVENFGTKWEMADNSIKLHSCCRFTNNFCDCAIEIHNKPGFDWTKVKAIHAECNRFTDAKLCNPVEVKRHPKNVVNAQFSLFYEIACGLVKGRVIPESFTEEAIRDERLAHLCDLITWEISPEFEAVYPSKYPARVTVTMEDGTTYVGEVEYPKGDPEYPASAAEITEKFHRNAANTIGSVKAERVTQLVSHMDELESIDELISCLY